MEGQPIGTKILYIVVKTTKKNYTVYLISEVLASCLNHIVNILIFSYVQISIIGLNFDILGRIATSLLNALH